MWITVTYVSDWALWFALTLAVELAVAVPLLGGNGSVRRRAAVVAVAQAVSHPVVWFVIPALGLSRARFLMVAEGWAVVAELALYRWAFPKLGWPGALAVSALANGASVVAGLFIRALAV